VDWRRRWHDASVRLHDAATGQLVPLPDDDPVRVYVCGITPYDTTHLGHAATFLQADALVRVLRHLGRRVHYVQNVTDIDDSILARARRTGVDWRALGDEQTARYLEDMRLLGWRPPDRYARATDAMAEILELTGRLLDRGNAYRAEGGMVYFRVASVPTYGEISGLSRDQMLRIAAEQDDADLDDPRKEDPLDFALWKGWSGDAAEPWWDSPWGRGRPGWHIECSAINHREHGSRLTIHGGGGDLAFPHHENETAQSEAATGIRPWVRAWWRVAMVRMDGEKMSKSLGNMVFARDLLERHDASAIRSYVLSHHYRTEWEWSEAELEEAGRRLDGWRRAARGADAGPGDARDAFDHALAHDLDLPAALDVLDGLSGPRVRSLGAVLGLSL
jgi:L-cysteine:1D-myo-inositol 2-amino-2-deoxy-alpha-D-glucopyranoside ligase